MTTQSSLLPDPQDVEIAAKAEIEDELFRAAVEQRKAQLRLRKKPWYQRLWLYFTTNRKV